MPNNKSAAFASGQQPAPIYKRAPPGTAGLFAPAVPADAQRARATGSRATSPPRIAVGARRAGEIRPSGLARGRYLARAVAPGARPWRAARGAAGRGKSYFSMGPRGRLPRGAGTPAEEPACAPTRLDFRTAAPRERRSGSPSPRTSPASARRAHTGAHAPAHSHALHTHGVSSPTPVPSSRGLPAPRRGPTQFTRPQPPARALRDQSAEARGP